MNAKTVYPRTSPIPTPKLSPVLPVENSAHKTTDHASQTTNGAVKNTTIRFAPNGPGIPARWTSSAKTGLGTALSNQSHVWFTLSHGVFNEIYYPRIDQACIRDLGLIVTDGANFFSEEKRDAGHTVEWLADGVPAFKLVNTCRDGRYRIEKQIVTDPHRDTVLQSVQFHAQQGALSDYHLHVLLAPHLGNHGGGNTAWVGEFEGTPVLFAQRNDCALALACSAPWTKRSVGYVGSSDGWQDLKAHHQMTWEYTRAENGNVALTAGIDLAKSHGKFVLALGFGKDPDEAARNAVASLRDGFDKNNGTLRIPEMLRTTTYSAVLSFAILLTPAQAQQGRGGGAPLAGGRTPSIEERVANMQKLDGYFPLYWDERTGSILLEIPRFDVEFLLTTGLAAGLGSNDLGLDRGQEGGGRLVSFERIGPKVLLVQHNESFRSSSANPAERRSVEDSFAKSVLWGFTVAADAPNGHVLVDATEFVLRDGHGAAAALNPGPYRVDRARSAVYMARTKAFPKNTEIEVTLTFANEATGGRGGFGGPTQGPPPIQVPSPGTAPGGRGGRGGFGGGLFSGTIASVTPSPESVTLREHYSLVELPDNNYKPREDDPRAGYFGLTYVDYSTPIGDPMVRHFIHRHRLEKKDPSAAVSEAVKPIQYWVDPGAPEDVRQALIEGASWWNQAFEAAGFRNAFKVEVLPPGADPMDIRYNMINWVHRSTRGWSSGGSVADPRTGEIIKTTVTLGSLRDRQDYMIFEGLLSPYLNGTEKPEILYQTALARIRQLAAHEVGHTLGLGHNYYDSTQGWISVMDYPHPQEKLNDDGTIDISHAYPARIGDWDKVAINYGYRVLPTGDEKAALTHILDEAWDKDLRYLTNQDTDTHPRVDQWSNGVNQADELNRLMKVRRAALNRLGEHTIRNGAPMATIEEPLVPMFMYHRYSVESAASMVAGIDYIYAMRGDGRTPLKWETAANQRKALDALANTLKPSELTVPKQILDAIPPRPPGYGMHRELFARTTGDGFDPLSPATIASDVTVGFTLQLDRAARLVAQHALDPSLPGLDEVIDRLTRAIFDAPAANPYEAEVRRAEERVLVDRVMWLATGAPNSQVRAIASERLLKLAARLRSEASSGEEQAQRMLLAADIKRFLERPADPARPMPAPGAPPGAPIGDYPLDWLSPAPW